MFIIQRNHAFTRNRDKADEAHFIKGKFQRLKDYLLFFKKEKFKVLGLTFGIQEHDVFPLVC